ncbi:Hypothetical protein PHPALM_13560 [Phytophthora palmivora]|uniref:Uncharacterized protein n=1 Tax=Phytophthora palmivora TaxID=4796 RepID=A0A2P4XWY7_9STRA|nr:Hypothetical protein PHPALM_13560 [Phytophthora palmivora]
MEEAMITWNQEELLEISQFLESSSNKSRRRERRRRSGSGSQTASNQSSRRRQWSEENSSSSATSNGQQESDGRYDYSDSPTAENLYKEENMFFEEESVESGPWTECLPNGKWTVVFDEDRQEYVRIRVPGTESEALGSSRVIEKPQVVCIDELD